MAAYLTETEALERLAAYGIDDSPTQGDLLAASLELDSMGPWAGETPEDQELQFPRLDAPLDEDDNPIIPEAILDAVALIAYSLYSDDEPPITSETFFGHHSVTYASPKEDQNARRVRALISPYRSEDAAAGSLEVASSFSGDATYYGTAPYGYDPWGYPIGYP